MDNPLVDPRKDLLYLIGQSIEDDVETYDIDKRDLTMLVTRDGKTFRVRVEEAQEP